MEPHKQSPWPLGQRPCGATFPDKAGMSIGGSSLMILRGLSNQTLPGYNTFVRFSTIVSKLLIPKTSPFLPVSFS